MSTQPAAREVARVCGATLRALTGNPALRLRSECWTADLALLRGIADGMAMRTLLSDADLHGRLSPREPAAQWVFDVLEQYRVESLAQHRWPGVRRNLEHRHQAWTLDAQETGLADTAAGLLLYTVLQTCRARLFVQPVPDAAAELIEATRARLAPLLGASLHGLRSDRHDQRAYAVHAIRIAGSVARSLPIADPRGEGGLVLPRRSRRSLASRPGLTPASDVGAAGASRDNAVIGRVGEPYRIFSTAYDRVLRPRTLLRPERVRELRRRLDACAGAAMPGVQRVRRALESALGGPAEPCATPEQEEGRLDGRRLATLIASPAERRIFISNAARWRVSCAAALLIDCSGSMKQHAELMVFAADLLTRALELMGASCEVLGFTTGAWHGGRALRDWRRGGCPPRPGRLGEVWHLVLKEACESWRAARQDLAALLHTEMYREGLDGEAVLWACQRLRAQPARHRLLIVFSDGGAMDRSTVSANEDDQYIRRHLAKAADECRAAGVHLLGVGVGEELDALYERSCSLDLRRPPDARLLDSVISLVREAVRA